MGSNKFLIIAFAIVSALALSLVGVSAAEMIEADTLEVVFPSEDFPVEREEELEEDVVLRDAVETFPADPLLETEYYSYYCSLGQLPTASANAFSHVFSITVYSNGRYLWGRSFQPRDDVDFNFASIWRSSYTTVGGLTSFDVIWGSSASQRVTLSIPSSESVTVYFTSSDSSQSFGGSTVSGTVVNSHMVSDLADSVFSVGDAFITFIISSWVVLLPLAAWLVVLCIGAIRKLVKGV